MAVPAPIFAAAVVFLAAASGSGDYEATEVKGMNDNHALSEAAWPAPTIAELTRLYVDDGLTCAEIGQRIGKSKNAVISKRHRLKLVPRCELCADRAANRSAQAARATQVGAIDDSLPPGRAPRGA